jgi:hypothetical protein
MKQQLEKWKPSTLLAALPLALGGFLLAAQSVAAAPINDNFADATVLPVSPGLLSSQTNVSATAEGETTSYGALGVWYSWTPAVSGDVQLNTCGTKTFDTVLGVYQGSMTNRVVENDDACGSDSLGSKVQFTATAGTTYHFRFGSYATATGTADIYWGYVKAITSLSVSSGSLDGGTAVTITGIGFTDTTSVTFGGIAGTGLVVVDDTTITVTTPAGTAAGAVDVVVSGTSGDDTLVGGFTYIDETPATEFAANEESIRQVLIDDATRGLRSTLSSNRKMASAARDRFIEAQKQGDTGASVIDTPVNVDGDFDASSTTISSKGTFFGQSGFGDGGRRLVFGDFDVQHDQATESSTATLNGKIAWEQFVSDKTMLGYFIGGQVARSNIAGTFEGSQNRFGVSVGGYVVQELADQIYLDGFLSLGAGRNDLTMSDSVLDLDSDYTTRSATIGAALSGVIEQKGFEIWPELSFSLGRTWLGEVGFTGAAHDLVDDTLSLDAGTVTLANILFRPEVRVPMDGLSGAESLQLFTFAPRLMCEQVRATVIDNDCGAGAEFGFAGNSVDGLSTLSAKVMADRVDGSINSSVQLNLQHRF